MKKISINNINNETKSYIIGILLSFVILFITSAVLFLLSSAENLRTVITEPPEVTFTYVISLIDRVLLFIAIFIIIPLTIYQISSKNKALTDKIVSFISIIVIFTLIILFLGGEYHYFRLYKSGMLKNSPLFQKQTIETKVFDKLR